MADRQQNLRAGLSSSPIQGGAKVRGSLDQPWALGLFVIGLLAFPYPAYGIFDPVTPNPVSGRPMSAQTIIPADVLARAEVVRDELEPSAEVLPSENGGGRSAGRRRRRGAGVDSEGRRDTGAPQEGDTLDQ